MSSLNPIRYTSIWHENPTLEVILRECIEENRSASVASEMLSNSAGHHISKCAAMSKAKRLGLKFKSVKPNRKPDKFDKSTGRQRVRQHRITAPVIVEPITPTTPITGMLGLELWQLEPNQCRWPEGDKSPYLFCGLPTLDGASWCHGHCAVVFEHGPRPGIKRYSPSMPKF